jgi:drug/metabolite transporter (DMT)-like permease
MSARIPTHPFFLLSAASAFWGFGTVLSKLALDRGIPPVTLLAVEMGASSSVLLLTLLAATRFRPRVRLTADYRRVVILGALNPALGYALGLWGLVTVSASLAVLVWAIEPVIVVVLAVPLLGERPERRTVALVTVAVAGAVLVLQNPGTHGQLAGIALTLGAVLACALYTVLTRRLLLDDGSLVVVLGQQVLAFALVLGALVLGVVTGGFATGLPRDAVTLGLAAASGVVYYALAYVSYVAALRQVPAAVAASVLPLIPVWGLAAAFVAGDRLTTAQWLGAVVVGAAVLAMAISHRDRSVTLAAPLQEDGVAPDTVELGDAGTDRERAVPG